MTRAIQFGAVLGGLLILGACTGGDDHAASADGPLAVTDVWARATPAGTSVGAVYLTATSATGDALTAVDVDDDIAGSASLHVTMTSDSGQSTMDELDHLAVPAGGSLVLEPGADHVMLVDLAGPLVAGATFELVLRFTTAGDETVTVDVRTDAP